MVGLLRCGIILKYIAECEGERTLKISQRFAEVTARVGYYIVTAFFTQSGYWPRFRCPTVDDVDVVKRYGGRGHATRPKGHWLVLLGLAFRLGLGLDHLD